MATEILVNDGGAPARILPFTAGSTITAGYAVEMGASSEVNHVATSGSLPLGYAFTAATSGNICNVITGHGVMLNVFCSGANITPTGSAGTNSLGTSTQDGALCLTPDTADGHADTVALALESGSATAALMKVLTR
tara:strand:+ start:71 stop:478 length:408 start_codon:yes stop_codon:yes gene_type:complete